MAQKNSKKKVIIITYYWPPMGGGGVQRWLKMTKYLRDFGWEPIIFTVKNGEGSVTDHSLFDQIPSDIETHRVAIWEPFELYKKFTGKTKNEKLAPGLVSSKKQSWSQRLSIWIRGNVFIPDARKFWIKPATKYLDQYLQNNNVDAIVSTGPPHTTHLIALNIKKKHSIPWLADFRDPWTNIDFYDKLKLTKWADRQHHKLELNVVKTADQVVTVSHTWAKDFEKTIGIRPIVITNGYDPEDFIPLDQSQLDKAFTITHAGSLNNDRNPHNLWKVLGELVQNDPEIRRKLQIHLIGQVSPMTLEDLKRNGLQDNVELTPQLSHHVVIQKLQSSQVLLLLLNDAPNIGGIIPGKLYEYIGAKRPILCIGLESGDAASILRETRSGKVIEFENTQKMKTIILEYFGLYQKGQLRVDSQNFNKYSRKVLAQSMTRELDRLVESGRK